MRATIRFAMRHSSGELHNAVVLATHRPRTRVGTPGRRAESLDELTGNLVGVVTLPLRLSWSGPADRRAFDLTVEHDRRMLYEVVLTEGNIDDVRNYVNPAELLRLWSDLWLSPHVRRAWQPLIAAATAA